MTPERISIAPSSDMVLGELARERKEIDESASHVARMIRLTPDPRTFADRVRRE